jgi:patatin-like phospholipase/acyl hydrolase
MFTDRHANSLRTRRQRQPWPKDRTFKILALDGGGIKGIYTAELLRRCEETLGRGEPIARFFDMIAGTSTGGIIALGLGLGISTADITSFYRDDGRKIFPPLPGRWLGRACQMVGWAFGPKLAHEELEEALKHRFEDHLLGESAARLVIPAFMMPKTEIAVFKTDHHEDFRNDHRTPMWKVARSTSAAPTYLKGHEHEESGRIFIDGGVWANNPLMVALVDALTAYDLTPEQIDVFSIGTGNAPFELGRPDVFGGMWAWKEVIKAAMFLTTDNATAQAKLLLGPDHCLRLEPAGEDARVEMDDYDAAFARLPNLAERDFLANEEAISRFFVAAVWPRERYYSL